MSMHHWATLYGWGPMFKNLSNILKQLQEENCLTQMFSGYLLILCSGVFPCLFVLTTMAKNVEIWNTSRSIVLEQFFVDWTPSRGPVLNSNPDLKQLSEFQMVASWTSGSSKSRSFASWTTIQPKAGRSLAKGKKSFPCSKQDTGNKTLGFSKTFQSFLCLLVLFSFESSERLFDVGNRVREPSSLSIPSAPERTLYRYRVP